MFQSAPPSFTAQTLYPLNYFATQIQESYFQLSQLHYLNFLYKEPQ